MIAENEFLEWLKSAGPGEWITYHIGQHLFGLNGQKKLTASIAFREAEQGVIFICQRRTAVSGEFEYRAMKLTPTLAKRMQSWRLG